LLFIGPYTRILQQKNTNNRIDLSYAVHDKNKPEKTNKTKSKNSVGRFR